MLKMFILHMHFNESQNREQYFGIFTWLRWKTGCYLWLVVFLLIYLSHICLDLYERYPWLFLAGHVDQVDDGVRILLGVYLIYWKKFAVVTSVKTIFFNFYAIVNFLQRLAFQYNPPLQARAVVVYGCICKEVNDSRIRQLLMVLIKVRMI